MTAPAVIPSRRRPWTRSQIALTALGTLVSAVWIAPLLWMLSTSLKPNGDTVKMPVRWIPEVFTLDAYESMLSAGKLPVWFVNSVVVSVCVTTLTVLVAALAGYGFARTEFRFRRTLLGLTMAGLMVPGTVITAPLFSQVESLGMVDTYWGVILPQVAAPAMVFILYKFFQGVPRELEEAAQIDGAGRWRILVRIVLPLSRPSLAAVGIFTFIGSWNNFMWPYLVINDPDKMTLPVGIGTVMDSYGINWAQLMAGGLLAGFPLLLVFVFFQRQIVSGVAHTGLAGQ